MAGSREVLAQAVTARLTEEGIDSNTATYLGNAVAIRATFDTIGAAIDLGAVVALVKAENVDLIGALAQSDNPDTRSDGLNPWKAGDGFNITKQAILTNIDPQLAARLKVEAGP